QEVSTNPQHDPQGDRQGTVIRVLQQVCKIEGPVNRYAIDISVQSDPDNSKNPPYTFMLHAHALFAIGEAGVDAAAESALITTAGAMVLIGAIRERLAELTSRAPWGRFLLNVVNLQAPAPAAQTAGSHSSVIIS